MGVSRIGFLVDGDGIEPRDDPAWHNASRSARLEFWAFAGLMLAKEWDAQAEA